MITTPTIPLQAKRSNGTSSNHHRCKIIATPFRCERSEQRNLHYCPFFNSLITLFTLSSHDSGTSQKPFSVTNSLHSGFRALIRAIFFSSPHIFHLIFSMDSGIIIRERFIIDTVLAIVSVSKRSFIKMSFVLCHTLDNVNCTAYIEYVMVLVCHNVSESRFHSIQQLKLRLQRYYEISK